MKTVLKVIMQLADYDLNVADRAAGRGRHNKNIRLGTAAKYKKKLEKLFKEKRNSKTGLKGGKYTWDGYDDDNPYQDHYGDD